MAKVGYTQAEIDELKAAIASGVLSVTYSGPPSRTVQYNSLPEMNAQLARMMREVHGTRRFRTARVKKGFRK